jgi:hypothetical protein
MSTRKTPIKPNGHAGPPGRVNGHALASSERGGIPVPRDQAASDDTRRASAAMDASSIHAPGTDCAGCAEAAPPSSGKTNGHALVVAKKSPTGHEKKEKKRERIRGGDIPLPLHPGEFVDEIHRNTDLFISWQELLNSEDEKVRQRAVEKVTEMRYKGAAALADEPQRIVIDMPGPKRD